MRHEAREFCSAAILKIDFRIRDWARHPDKKIPVLMSTRFRIHSGLKNIHSGESEVSDSPATSTDTCGNKVADSKLSGYMWMGL